jgi:hypothetical protein
MGRILKCNFQFFREKLRLGGNGDSFIIVSIPNEESPSFDCSLEFVLRNERIMECVAYLYLNFRNSEIFRGQNAV